MLIGTSQRKCARLEMQVGDFDGGLGSLLEPDSLLSHRLVRLNGYTPKVISFYFKC